MVQFDFLTIRFLDIIDILLVAFLMYRLFILIRGTAALNIFIGIFVVYILWLLTKSLKMELVSTILGQIIGVGVIALIIVFQQEIRRFLLLLGTQYFSNRGRLLKNIFYLNVGSNIELRIKGIIKACINLSNKKTGALIVITGKSELEVFSKTGDILNAHTSSMLLECIFTKDSPLHDGAVIIVKDRIHAARCILPLSDNMNLPSHFGMRHRAAVGISEITDALVIVISEERGEISIAENGSIKTNISSKQLIEILETKYISTKKL